MDKEEKRLAKWQRIKSKGLMAYVGWKAMEKKYG